MAVIHLHDREGDPVYVDSDRIVGLESVDLRYEDDTVWRSTLVKCGGSQFVVVDPIEDVLRLWQATRGETAAPKINPHPEARGWEVHDIVARSRG